MRIDIISVVPDLLKSPFEASILKRAIDANLVRCSRPQSQRLYY